MGDPQHYTAAEIARRLTFPESTIRYYRDRFASYVPLTGEGRSRRFRPEAIDVLRFIAEQLRSGVPARNVESALADRFPLTVLPQLSTAATQQQSIDTLRTLLSDVVRDAVAAENEGLRTKMTALTAAVQQQSMRLGDSGPSSRAVDGGGSYGDDKRQTIQAKATIMILIEQLPERPAEAEEPPRRPWWKWRP